MKWIAKLIWRLKTNAQLLTANADADFWMHKYQGTVNTMKEKATYRWENFIKPEMERRGFLKRKEDD